MSRLASLAWLTLAVVTFGGGFLLPGSLPVNVAMAALFAAIGAALRLRAATWRPVSAMMLVVGLLLLGAAGFRVFGERLPVFG